MARPEDQIGGEIRPFTGAEYMESLKDGRAVYIYGERVANLPDHPAFSNAVRSIARLYDALHAPDSAAELTGPVDTGTGGRTHKYFRVARSSDDLIGQQGLSMSRRMLASTQLSAIKPPPPPDPNAVTQQAPRDSTISTETIEIPDETPSSRRSWILLIAAVLLALIAGAAVAFQWLNSPGHPDLVTYGTPLAVQFADGRFQDWREIDGKWGDLKNADGEAVLKG